MAYQTITESDGDQYRIYREIATDGSDDEIIKVMLKKNGYPTFELLFEGRPKYIVENQYQ